MIKAFAFDLDGTLTQHKTQLEDKNRLVLEKLKEKYKLVMVGAGSCVRIHKQLSGFPIDVIGNYGMQYAEYQNGELVIKRDSAVECKDKKHVEKTVYDFREKYGFREFSGDNVEYHASGCITFPILGTRAVQEDKLKFDPDRKKRRAIYKEVTEAFPEYNVFVGGSSSFDMAPKPYDKYYALDLWCKENDIQHDEIIFVGDDYGRGGNDESVYNSDIRFLTIDDYTRLSEILAPWISDDVLDVDGFLRREIDCDCGKKHSCEIEKVVIRNGALNELLPLCNKYKSILLVSDKNTRLACGNRVLELLSDKITSELTYESSGFLVPDEIAVEKLNGAIKEGTDLIIGVGSGVVNDLCKYVSNAHGLPYYIVATAPSMDGYASAGAAMIFGGMKITANARVPKAIIADTEILKNAPLDMLKAGYGDIIGKFSCLNDWRLSNVVNGEPLCDFIYKLTYDTVISVAELGEKIISRDEEAIATLMRALVVVGIAMAYMGNSRPASGSEHHLSHFFEVVGLLRGEEYFCHGIDVAYSTYVVAKLRRELLEINEPEAKRFFENSYEENVRRVYKGKNDLSCAEGIISLQKKLGWIYEDKSEIYREKWQEIKQILADSPSCEKVLEMLSSVELPMKDFENMYSKEKINEAILYAKYLKDRYTVLWLYDSIKL